MDWILNHLQVVVFIAIVIVGMLKGKRPAAKAPSMRDPARTEDAGEVERTRRVQEEIRRKIAARRAGTPAAASVPPVQPPAPLPPLVEEDREAREDLEAGAAQVMREDQELARQRALADQVTQLKTAVRAVERQAGMVDSLSLAPVVNPLRVAILADLRTPSSTRRALLLREILGEPVGLR